jgi:GT2 family glycosyltransferase
MITVRIILLNYNTLTLTVQALETVREECAGLPVEVCVVDNCSSDGSGELLLHRYGSDVIVRNERNLGFGAGMNSGVRGTSCDALLFLNSDVLLSRGALERAVDVLSEEPRAGLVGVTVINGGRMDLVSWMRDQGPLERLLRISFAVPERILTRLFGPQCFSTSETRQVPATCGCFMLMRRSAFDCIGGFDPGLFLYNEEWDLARRLAAKGWSIWVAGNGVVQHLAGASTSTSARRKHYVHSTRYYLRKHYGVHWDILARIVGLLCILTGLCAMLGVVRYFRNLSRHLAKSTGHYQNGPHQQLPAKL